MGEIKQANFRIDSRYWDAFRAFANKRNERGRGFDHVMQVFEVKSSQILNPGEVSRLRSLKPWLSPSPPHTICITWNWTRMQKRGTGGVLFELQRKELRLTELQKNSRTTSSRKKKMDAGPLCWPSRNMTTYRTARIAQKGAADPGEQINRMLKEKLEEAQNQLKKWTFKESEEMLRMNFTMQTGLPWYCTCSLSLSRRNRR